MARPGSLHERDISDSARSIQTAIVRIEAALADDAAAGVMARDPRRDDDRLDALRLAGWVAGVTLLLIFLLGILAYADVWFD
ncbi:hypothetical protein GGQ80_002778 [Sphingomonas jinjuensis]|uniref:Uncharacterized protein n=1 Tax=Sphingomonas jinjuensis TaxID=535907 RepID=A0A840FDX1_9SPHN|nr:hypothetical protein [Sphingomonas jinjuensis]MBB4154862.1 hypothetical protein [Sphingomonas jinjuensis]